MSLLQVKNLVVEFPTRRGTLRALDDPLRADSAAATLARFVVEDGRPGPKPA